MKILFLSRLVPKEYQSKYSKVSMQIMDDASIGLQERIMLGLSENEVNVKCINVIPIFSFNKCKVWNVPSFAFSYSLSKEISVKGKNVEFNNMPFIKQLSQNHHVKKSLKNELKTNNDVIVLAYSPFPAFFKSIIYTKRKYPQLKTCIIYPDLPNYISLRKNKSVISKLYTYYNNSIAKKAENYCNKAVFLTEHMSEIIHISDYTVMEGIATTNTIYPQSYQLASDNYIIYAGTLNERFGVLHLIRAFGLVKDPQLSIVICGIGDSEEKIIELSKTDNRIIFLGKQQRQTVLNYLVNAKAIVNPRLPGEEFTKYSFPSKNLEALSSGVPFIAYKLPGIPDEYDDYINYPNDLSERALASLIENICNDKSLHYVNKANKAKQFVYNSKNPMTVTTKIIEFLNKN